MDTSQTRYDLIVIGAGIQGAGVAQAAAAAGYRVLVLEQQAIAAGSSSRSSKLIHGGLRYLESLQFGLVRECLNERKILLKIAPHLVRLTPHYLPIYHQTHRRPSWVRLGLSLYAALGGLTRDVRFKRLHKQTWPGLDGLLTHGLQTVFQYNDGQTDDAALTAAVIQSAQQLGATLAMPATLTHAQATSGQLTVRYQTPEGPQTVICSALVNAAGPWVNRVLATITPQATPLAVDLVAGTHIVLSQPLTQGVYYTEAPTDGRAVFIMPWADNQTLVGTTETRYQGDPTQVAPTQAEIDYLLTTARHYFPRLKHETPSSAFAGLRVLPTATTAAFGRSRDTRLHRTHQGRVLSVYGGKLTAYRANAAHVIAQLQRVLPKPQVKADTATLRLP